MYIWSCLFACIRLLAGLYPHPVQTHKKSMHKRLHAFYSDPRICRLLLILLVQGFI